MVVIKKYHEETTGRILLEMKELLTGQLRKLRIDGVATDQVYRHLTHPHGNYGIALISIDGISDPYVNEVFYAHSKVGNPEAVLQSFLTHGIKFTPLGPVTQRFETLWVKNDNGNEYLFNGTGKPISQAEEIKANKDDFFNRNVCSESKILEYINLKLNNDRTLTGTIHIFTEKHPCLSCQGVIDEFVSVYNNLNITVYHER